MTQVLLVASALLPALVLCIYVFKKDRVEKEPTGLLVKLLILGALSCIPVVILELLLGDVIETAHFGKTMYLESAMKAEENYLSYLASKQFFGVGLVEEGMKLLFLVLATRKSKEFNSWFDGLIYAIFVSLGFAALENVLYVLQNGFINAIMRGVLSVPGHMFFAVMMGYYYSLWHITDKAKELEKALGERGIITYKKSKFSSKRYIVLSLLIPALAHAIYNFCCSAGTGWSLLALFAFVVFMYIYCFGKIKKMSVNDAYSYKYAKALLFKKYPEAEAAFSEE